LFLLILPRIHELYFLLILSVLLGITSGLSIPAVGAVVAVEGKSHGGMGELMGALSASKSLGRVAGPIVSGIVYDAFGSGITGIQMAFTVSAFLTMISALIFWFGIRRVDVTG